MPASYALFMIVQYREIAAPADIYTVKIRNQCPCGVEAEELLNRYKNNGFKKRLGGLLVDKTI